MGGSGQRQDDVVSERNGRVVSAAEHTFAGLETTAREVDAKGCFICRAHPQLQDVADFVSGCEEDDFLYGEFAAKQLMVAVPTVVPGSSGCSDDECEDESCLDETEGWSVVGSEAIRQACVDLVENLPSSIRDNVRCDAESLAFMCRRLCPDIPWLTMRLEIAQFNACVRWHQDHYVSRCILSYVGPGTCAADDNCVDWDQIQTETNASCVPAEKVIQMETNAVLLMKGNLWPGIRGNGLTHKSPIVTGDNPPKRLILKVDLHTTRPLLADEDEDGYDDAESADDQGDTDSESIDTKEQSDQSHDDNGPKSLKRGRGDVGDDLKSGNALKVGRL